MEWVVQLGAVAVRRMDGFGAFCRFCGRTFAWIAVVLTQRRGWREILYQFYQVGTRSVPVVMVTGIFVGAVLAVQSVQQFKAIGMISQMGAIVNLSVLRELGPIIAGLVLAGRVGGGQTAELGTMHVTEQIEALRAIGADPIRVLVVPRFLACVMLIPILALYASFMGILGGYIISVHLYGANAAEFWANAARSVLIYDVFYGPVKCLFFGGATSLICCYKGFTCQPGAAGVGHACTESFVASCLAIITLDFFLGMTLNTIIGIIWGVQLVLV